MELVFGTAIAFVVGVVLGTVEGPTMWSWLTTPSPAKVLASAQATIAAAEAATLALAKAHAVVAAAPKPVVAPVVPPAA